MKIKFKNKKNSSPWRATVFFGILGVILVVGGVVLLKNKEIEIKFDENGSLVVPDKQWYESPMQFAEKVVDLQERLEEIQKLDDFGGATPQETFDAFVEALKKGDTELASRYFVFNKQEQMKRELAVGKERGHLGGLIEILEKTEKGSFYTGRDDKYEFIVIGDSGKWDGVVEFTFNLVKNIEAGVWKMESL